MQNNYYFLKHLSCKLNEILSGFTLIECFSQNKDELVLHFSNQKNPAQHFYIKAFLSSSFSCLSFPNDYKRANSNTVDLFAVLIGIKIVEIVQHLNERAFTINFSNHFQLTFKMFGNKSNIILFKNGYSDSIFQSKYTADNRLKIRQLDRDINLTFQEFEANEYNIEKTIPTLGRQQADYIKSQYISNFPNSALNTDHFWDFALGVISNFSKPLFYISNINNVPTLSLIQLENTAQSFNDPILALNYFFLNYSKTEGIAKEKNRLINEVESRISKLKKSVIEITNRLNKFNEGASNEEIANILMANLHTIPERAEKIELFDFYRNRNISINLKPDLNPQKNAEGYYRKAKNERIEIDILEKKVIGIEANIENLNKNLVKINETGELKLLRKFTNNSELEPNKNRNEIEIPFKVIEMEGWQIWIGKNASNNDLLTQKYAKKDDLWLHARDVAGSHVIIRNRSGKVFPKNIIERAAELAAYYSKRKTDTICSVTVTPKKYVRKPKNTAAGKVIVDKEETLLVAPKGPN